MKSNRSPGTMAATLVALIVTSWSASASAQSTSGDDSEWVLTPYIWGTALNGTNTIGPLPPLEIDASFGDIFSNLDFAFAMHTEYRNGRWAFVLDPMYVSIEADVDPGLPPGTTPPKLGIDIWFVELWAGYEIADKWEIVGGARYQSQDLALSGLPSPPLPVPGLSFSEDWTDWFIGVRLTTDLSEKWFLAARLDTAIAGDSDSSTNASVMFNRRFGPNKSLNIGYRYFVNDYDNLPSFAWDMTQDGPVLGFTWAF